MCCVCPYARARLATNSPRTPYEWKINNTTQDLYRIASWMTQTSHQYSEYFMRSMWSFSLLELLITSLGRARKLSQSHPYRRSFGIQSPRFTFDRWRRLGRNFHWAARFHSRATVNGKKAEKFFSVSPRKKALSGFVRERAQKNTLDATSSHMRALIFNYNFSFLHRLHVDRVSSTEDWMNHARRLLESVHARCMK